MCLHVLVIKHHIGRRRQLPIQNPEDGDVDVSSQGMNGDIDLGFSVVQRADYQYRAHIIHNGGGDCVCCCSFHML